MKKYKRNTEKAREAYKNWAIRYPDRLKAKRLKPYGISVEQFREMENRCDKLCTICKQSQKNDHDLCVDHCHKTGRIRGLLCYKCNLTLGQFEKYEDTFKAYLANS